MSFLMEVLTSLTVSGLTAGALIWLTKSVISERLKNAIRVEYEQRLETHKAQLQSQSAVELERLRSQLSQATVEHQVRFSRLHEKRAEVIAELYKLLVQSYWTASSFSSLMEWAGEPTKIEKYKLAMDDSVAFFQFFDKHKIYLPHDICEKLENFVRSIREHVIGFGVYVRYNEAAMPPTQSDKKFEAWSRAFAFLEKEVPVARSELEAELRRILGDAS